MCERIAPAYYWPCMKRDIKLYTQTCPVCDKFQKSRSFKTPLGRIPVGEKNDLIAMDLLGGKESLPKSNSSNKYILVIVEAFTRYCVAIALENQSARTVCDAVLKHWLLIYGPPRRLLTDQGTNFESGMFHNMCEMWRIDKIRTTPYHPAAN